jgi:PAS domain S-box-containing protein
MKYFNHYYNKLRNWFIGRHLEDAGNSIKKNRLKIAFNVYLLYSTISILYIPYLASSNLNVQFYLALATLVVNGSLLFGLKYFDFIKHGGIIHIISLFAIVTFQIYYSQGYINFVTVSWFTVAAIFAFFQFGREAGTAVVAVSLLIMLVFILMKVNDYNFPSYTIDLNDYYTGVFISLSLVFSFIYMMVDRFTKYNSEMIESISASENRLSTIVENLPTGAVYLFNNKLFFNKEFIVLSGYTTNEINSIDKLINQLFPKEIEKEKLKFLELQKSEITSEDNAIQIVSKNNSIKTVEVSYQKGYNYEIILFKDVTKLKSKEKELDESTYFVENLATAIPHIIFLFDLNKKTSIYVNKALYQILGYLPNELYDKSIIDLLHNDDVEKVNKHIEQLNNINDDELAELEYRVKGNNGTYIWVRSIHKIFKRNNEGEPIIAIGIAENITNKKNAEVKYKDLNERLLLATSAVNFGVWDWDLETNEFYWDDAMYKLFGTTRKKYPNPVHAFQKCVHPDDYEKAWIGIEEAYKRNEKFENTFRIIMSNNEVRYINVIYKVFKDEKELPYRVMGLNHDVTERKEQEIQQKQNHILTNIINTNGNILFTSENFTEAINLFLNNLGVGLGFDEITIYENIENKTLKQCYNWKKNKIEYNNYTPYFDKNESEIIKLILLHIDSLRNYSVDRICSENKQLGATISSLNIESILLASIFVSGQFWGVLVIKDVQKRNKNEQIKKDDIRSLTNIIGSSIAQKKHKQDLIIEKERAELASKAKTAFLASVSHEIRTPLNAISGLTKLLMQTSSPDKVQEKLKLLQFSADKLTYMVNEILDFSKLESGKTTIESHALSLKNIVEEIASTNIFIAEKKQFQFNYEIDRNIPVTLFGDSLKLRHAIINLLKHAIKNTNKEFIKLSINFEKKIKDKTLVAFSIVYSGKEDIKYLPSDIIEISNHNKSDNINSELILTITSKLIDVLGGNLLIENNSTTEKRLAFKLLFNNKPEITLAATANENKQYNFSGIKFLLAEDNEINALIATKFLTLWGATVIQVDNGNEALEKMETEDFDMILLDMFMPELDGYATATKIRALSDSKKANIPIIAITASALDEVFDIIYKCGINDYITKPFSPVELNNKIKKLLFK